MRRIALFATFACLLACGGDDGGPAIPDASVDAAIDAAVDAALPDARQPALGCINDPDPTTADDPITLDGSANAVGLNGATPVPGATLDVLLRNDPNGTPLTSGVTDANGTATLTVATGGVPISSFVRVTPADTYLTTELFAPAVQAASQPAPGVLLDTTTVSLLGIGAGQTQQAANGLGIVLVLDCDQLPVAGATVTPPTGTVVYAASNGQPDPGLAATSEVGLAFVFNITPGEDLLFDAEVMGMSLQDNTVRAVANQIVSLAIAP